VAGLDILIVRELTGDIYFGQPRGIVLATTASALRLQHHALHRERDPPHRACRPSRRHASATSVCSVDKMNVLECTQLWRDVAIETAKEYPDVELTHMLVDNAAMQLVKNPKQFDVMVTGNMFGDILSDEASMLTGSIGMLPSASLDANNKGLYEPIARLGAGHCRQGRGQSAGDHPFRGHDAALHFQ
jgi:3-isopropylmalate dehydrogenase